MASYFQKDQLSIKTRTQLADLLADLTIIVQSIESYRNGFARIQFFDGVELFRYLDRDEKGFLTAEDFSVVVSDYSNKILHYAFSWFDVSKTGQVTKLQFLQFLYPRQNSELRNLITRRTQQAFTSQQKSQTLPLQLDNLRSLTLQLMQRQTKTLVQRRLLMNQDDYTFKAVLNCLDPQKTGFITPEDLYKFLRNYDIEVEMSNVCELLGVFDHDRNGKMDVDQLEFLVEGLERSDSKYRAVIKRSYRRVRTRRARSQCTCKKIKRDYAQQVIQKKITYQSNKKMNTTSKKFQAKNQRSPQSPQSQSHKKTKQKFHQATLNFDSNLPQPSRPAQKENLTPSNPTRRPKKPKGPEQHSQVKHNFLQLEYETELLDNDLRQMEEQLNRRNQLEMEEQLERAKVKRKLKMEEKERYMLEVQRVRKEEELVRLEQQAMHLRKLKQQQQLQIQRQKQQQHLHQLHLHHQTHQKHLQQQHHNQLLQKQRLHSLQLQLARSRELELQKQLELKDQERRLSTLEVENVRLREREVSVNRRLRELMEMRVREGVGVGLYEGVGGRRSGIGRRLEEQYMYNIKARQIQQQIQAQLQKRRTTPKLPPQAYDRQILLHHQSHLLKQAQITLGSALKLKSLQLDSQPLKNRPLPPAPAPVDWHVQARLQAIRDEEAIRLLGTGQLDWEAEARIRLLHEDTVERELESRELYLKESQYLSKYRMYCNHLAQVADPLGIKQHIAQTDQYLMRSRQLRDQIKKDRIHSLDKYMPRTPAPAPEPHQKQPPHSTQNPTATQNPKQRQSPAPAPAPAHAQTTTPQNQRDRATSYKKNDTTRTKLQWS